MPFFRLLALLFLLALPAAAQDPVKVAPQAYKLEFENDWIKVLRVHYASKVKLPEHDHPPTAAAYVYLNDSEKDKPSKLQLDTGKTGWIEQGALIEFENAGDAPAELLRFDLKTKPLSGDQLKPPNHAHD